MDHRAKLSSVFPRSVVTTLPAAEIAQHERISKRLALEGSLHDLLKTAR
jgi:predicted transposase YdaD